MPEWNLDDLYCGLDDPAIKRDLDRADAECVAFEEAYKGKLAELARSPRAAPAPARAALAEAVRRYEAIDDLMGRLVSYAGLVHAGDTVDPARTKFFGDVQDRMTAASTHLLFFTLELNRIDDALCSKRRWPIPRSAITGRGSRTCAATSPTSSRIASSSCFTKSR